MEKIRNYTLIILTYNRKHLFRKLILHLSAKRVGFKILVLDSSEDMQKKENRMVSEKSVLDINYIEYNNEIDPLFKVYDGLKRVDTKYVSFCADDDLLLTDAIPDCIDFLEKNADYVACHGYYINIGNELKKEEFNIGLEYGSPSLDGETFETRVFQLLTNYQAIFYAVFKCGVVVEYFDAARNIDADSALYRELFTGIAPLVSGKVKRLGSCYYVRARQTYVPSHDYGPRWAPSLWLADDPGGFVQAFTKYREVLKKFIDERSDHKIRDLDKMLSLLHAIYFFKSFDLSYIQRIVQRDFKIDTLTAQKDKMAFVRSLQHRAHTLYRKIFIGEPFVRRKSNPKGSITFKIPKNISESIVNQSVLIDLQNYLLGVDTVQ
jgi:glycosyltransferase domain-containing protein